MAKGSDMKAACQELRQGKVLRFWFCEKGADGNPLLLLDRKLVPLAEIKAARAKAKSKKACDGHLAFVGGQLVAFTDSAPAQFGKGMKAALKSHWAAAPEAVARPSSEADAALTAEASDTGAQALGEEYRGESEAMGWRGDQPLEEQLYGELKKVLANDALRAHLAAALNTDEERLAPLLESIKGDPAKMRALLKRSRLVTTKYHTDAEAQAGTVAPDAEGRLTDARGARVTGTRKGYVIDAASGDVRTFADEVERGEDGGLRKTHHSSPVRGGDVVGAGRITATDGVVEEIDDESGHYKPDATKTLNALRHLERLGVQLIEDTLLDAAGKAVTEKGLLDAARRLKEIQKDWDRENAARKRRGEKPLKYPPEYDAARAQLQEAHAWFSNRAARVKLLGKEGLSAEDVEQRPGLLTSLQSVNFRIGKRTSVTLSKQQFEQTGGNEQQIRAKAAVNAQVRRKVTKKKPAAKSPDRDGDANDSDSDSDFDTDSDSDTDSAADPYIHDAPEDDDPYIHDAPEDDDRDDGYVHQ